jgi:hypothetical protein
MARDASHEPSVKERTPAWLSLEELWIPVALGLLALGLRSVHLNHAPNLDEINHIMAARQYLADGTLEVLGEPYVRARFFTFWVIGLMSVFGDSLAVARLPGVIPGALGVVVLYVFVRWQAGRLAGAVAGLLLATWPTAIYLSQTSRFYALHSLAFLAAAVALYAATLPAWKLRFRALAVALAIPPLALAWHLQPVTLLGGVGLGLWVVGSLTHEVLTSRRVGTRRLALWMGGGALVLGVPALAWLLTSDWFAGMWRLFHYAPAWAEQYRTEFTFYHRRIQRDYQALWTVLPLVLLVAGARRPRLTLFASTVFFVALALHSFAAWKVERYLFYALPYFFIVSGVAIAAAIAWFPGAVQSLIRGDGSSRLSQSLVRSAQVGLGITALAFFLWTNGAFRGTVRILDRDPDSAQITRSYGSTPAWGAAVAAVAPYLGDPSFVFLGVTSLPAHFHVGRVDFTIGQVPGKAYEITPTYEPSSEREGIGEIWSPEALDRVMACHPHGIALIDASNWRIPWGVTDPIANLLEARAQDLGFPDRWGMIGFRWDSPVDPHSCRP